jgi:thiol-disulfide isomerase/thioredoxin
VRSTDLDGKNGLLVIFLCRHCPYVQHVRKEFARIGEEYVPKGISVAAISANYVGDRPEDSPEKLKEMAAELKLNFPVLYDESQETAKAYTAACTPDIFLFGPDRRLVYRGQLDDSRPGNTHPVTGKDLRSALDAVFSGRSVSPDQRPSTGCNIKWKPGNEPPYYG